MDFYDEWAWAWKRNVRIIEANELYIFIRSWNPSKALSEKFDYEGVQHWIKNCIHFHGALLIFIRVPASFSFYSIWHTVRTLHRMSWLHSELSHWKFMNWIWFHIIYLTHFIFYMAWNGNGVRCSIYSNILEFLLHSIHSIRCSSVYR